MDSLGFAARARSSAHIVMSSDYQYSPFTGCSGQYADKILELRIMGWHIIRQSMKNYTQYVHAHHLLWLRTRGKNQCSMDPYHIKFSDRFHLLLETTMGL